MNWLVKALATCGYLTYIPAYWRPGSRRTGAGLIGTAVGVVTLPFMPNEPMWQLAALIGGLLMAVGISHKAEKLLDVHDDPRIVIDEWIGFWVGLAWLPHRIAYVIGGFLLFRLFDVWKPGWVGRAADCPGGWGIVMDDVAAGVLTNLCLRLAAAVHLF